MKKMRMPILKIGKEYKYATLKKIKENNSITL